MTKTILPFDGKRIVFGLEWTPLPGEKDEKSELRTLVDESGAAYHVRFEGANNTIYGLLPSEDLGDKFDKSAQYISASMLLATFEGVAKEAIWIEVGEDNLARVAVLEGGSPAPSGDFCGSVAEAEKIIRQIQEDSGLQFTFYGAYSENYADTYIPLTLSDLIEGGDLGLATLDPCQKSAGKNLKLGVILVLIIAGVFGFMQFQKMQEQNKLMALQQAQKKSNPAAQYKIALDNALPSAGVPASNSSEIFLGGWQKQVVEAGGWRLSAIKCSIAECRFKWRIVTGTNQSLTDALGDLAYEYSNTGKEISYSVPNVGKQTKTLDYAALPTFSKFMLGTGSFAQDLELIGASVTLDAPAFFAAETGIDMSAIESPIKFGKVSVVTKLALLKEILAKMPDNVTFSTLEINTDTNEPVFTLEGNYYVKD